LDLKSATYQFEIKDLCSGLVKLEGFLSVSLRSIQLCKVELALSVVRVIGAKSLGPHAVRFLKEFFGVIELALDHIDLAQIGKPFCQLRGVVDIFSK